MPNLGQVISTAEPQFSYVKMGSTAVPTSQVCGRNAMRCVMCWAQSPACGKPLTRVNYHRYCAIQNTGALSHTHPNTFPMLLPAQDCESSLHESSNSLLWLTLALYSPQASPATPISPCQNTAGHFTGSTEMALGMPVPNSSAKYS